MQKNHVAITIGIPAYNEEKNIGVLLRALANQRVTIGTIHQIIVISDGSTDTTVDEIRRVYDPRITLLAYAERRGVVALQQEIVKRATGDILIILNADVVPRAADFIDRVSAPLVKNPAVGLVGAATCAAPPGPFFERVIARSHEFKTALYKELRGGETIYLCHGRARAFSRDFYQKLNWPDDCPEDSFSYLACQRAGFAFVYAETAQVVFRSPKNLPDHVKQSRRYIEGRRRLSQYFDPQTVRAAHRISFVTLLRVFGRYLLRYPIDLLAYTGIAAYVSFLAPRDPIDQSRWDISVSSKQLLL